MFFSNFFINLGLWTIAAIILALIVLKIAYVIKKPAPMGTKKPVICWLPKFHTEIQSQEPAADEAARKQRFGEILESFGFRKKQETPSALTFTRGSAIGDLSSKLTKIDVTVQLPLSETVRMNVEYAVFAGVAFDTGDLWKLTNELQERLEMNW